MIPLETFFVVMGGHHTSIFCLFVFMQCRGSSLVPHTCQPSALPPATTRPENVILQQRFIYLKSSILGEAGLIRGA